MSEERIETLKGIIRDLHAGRDMAELKRRFSALTTGVSATEIAEMERQLIAEGMPEAEIKRLCDVHTEVFRDALDAATPRALPSDHPVEALRREGEELTRATAGLRRAAEALGSPPAADGLPAARAELEAGITRLATVEGHWRRKEYQLFPILEKHGIVAPPKVMWAIHDDVRTLLKASREHLASDDAAALAADIATLTRTVDDMVYKEEKILYPMCLDTFTAEDWDTVRFGETERAGAETARTTLAGAGDAVVLRFASTRRATGSSRGRRPSSGARSRTATRPRACTSSRTSSTPSVGARRTWLSSGLRSAAGSSTSGTSLSETRQGLTRALLRSCKTPRPFGSSRASADCWTGRRARPPASPGLVTLALAYRLPAERGRRRTAGIRAGG